MMVHCTGRLFRGLKAMSVFVAKPRLLPVMSIVDCATACSYSSWPPASFPSRSYHIVPCI